MSSKIETQQICEYCGNEFKPGQQRLATVHIVAMEGLTMKA
jgi:hypothetical protein